MADVEKSFSGASSAAEVVGVAGQLLFGNALGAVLAGMIVVQ
jgi:hypothetical protein